MIGINHDIDPENNFFKNVNTCRYYTEEQFNNDITLDRCISIIHFNSRSLYANFNHIKEYLSKFTTPFNVIAVSESWLCSERGMEFELEGYELHFMNRKRQTKKTGGGTVLYVDKRLRHKIVESMTTAIEDICECVTIEIDMEKNKNIIVSCVYRNPSSSIDTFQKFMEETFAKTDQKIAYICGDYNIDLLNPHKYTGIDEFIEVMYSMSLFPIITQPSRITSHSATIIDNIFTNNIEDNIVSGLLINDISDHLPVFAIYDCDHCLKRGDDEPGHRRLRSDAALNALDSELQSQDWKNVYEEESADLAYDHFLETFLQLYERNCPLNKFRKNPKTIDKPWITTGLSNACKKKNTLYKDFIKYRTRDREIKYKAYKNKLMDIIRNRKKEYYDKSFENNKNNIKGTWNILNSIIRNKTKSNYIDHIIDNNKIIKDRNEVAEGFNNFFVNVGPNLAREIIPPQRSDQHFDERNTETFFLRSTDKHEIIDTVRTFKNKKSTDWNDIDMALIKTVINSIADPLVHICNLSFKTGSFPCQMKIAKVIPIHKEGDKHLCTNYRPVSLLSQFSKILERLFSARMDSFIEKHNVLTDSQYGFRSSRSTSMALIDLIEELTTSVDSKKYALGVFIDLKKAFDTIDHEILLHKMDRYGFRGVGLEWIKSYIENRQQFVQLGEYRSSRADITCGVPQGSILGPKLFILYINDICKVSSILKFIIFADDTNIFCSGENLQRLMEVVSTELEKLKLWFDSNKLSLNIKKTKYIIFGNKTIDLNSQLMIDKTILERVDEYTFLGVIIDQKFSWKAHIKHVRNKVARSIGILYKAKHILSYNSLIILYNSLILPYMTYCVEVWGNTYPTNLQPLSIIQKRAIRVVHKVGYLEHTNALFLRSNALKFMDIIEYKTAQIIYKARKNVLPRNLQDLFRDREGGYELRREHNLKQLWGRTTLKSMCISVKGVKLWNGIPEHVKQSKNIKIFKDNFKMTLMGKYRHDL